MRTVSYAGRVTAVLLDDRPVRLLNVSASGCLLEAWQALEPGAEGTLSVVLSGHELNERISVVRCQPLRGGGSRCLVGARFVTPHEGAASPLRALLHEMETQEGSLG